MTISPRTRAALRALPVADLRAMLDGVRARGQAHTAAPAARRPTAASTTGASQPNTPRVTPAVAARARAHEVDPSTLTGTGTGGRVTTADVDRAADDQLYARLFGG